MRNPSQAVAQSAHWRSQGLDLRMSVNLSASNLLDTGLPGRLAALLAEHQELAPPELVRHITRAVTESCNGELNDDATVVCLDWHPQQTRAL